MMPLGVEVGLGPGDIVLDEEPAPPTERGTAAPPPRLLFGSCLLWPNGRPSHQLLSSCNNLCQKCYLESRQCKADLFSHLTNQLFAACFRGNVSARKLLKSDDAGSRYSQNVGKLFDTLTRLQVFVTTRCGLMP